MPIKIIIFFLLVRLNLQVKNLTSLLFILVLQLLTDVHLKCLNDHNAKGHTPLHMACLADKPECVKALMLAGADCNISAATENFSESDSSPKEPGILGNLVQEFSSKLHTQDMKFGGTPLHWSCSREVVESLLEKKCHINALNFDGRSALHLMVSRKKIVLSVFP